MDYSALIFGYVKYVIATVGTPGPNNIMIASSGANFGIRRSIPHVMGICLGFIFMMIVMGFGLGQMFEIYPITLTILKVLSVGFLLYLAFKIATSKKMATEGEATSKPLTFMQAAAFQWVNPKAWAMNVTAITLFASGGDDKFTKILIMVAINLTIALPLILGWCFFGREIGKFLKSERAFKIFNYSMAGLLVITVFTLFT